MDERGVLPVIFGLPIILAAIIILVLTGVIFTFFKSLAIAVVLGVVGGYIVFKVLPGIEKKANQPVIAIGFVMLFAALLIGVFQPFSIIGSSTDVLGAGTEWMPALSWHNVAVAGIDTCTPQVSQYDPAGKCTLHNTTLIHPHDRTNQPNTCIGQYENFNDWWTIENPRSSFYETGGKTTKLSTYPENMVTGIIQGNKYTINYSTSGAIAMANPDDFFGANFGSQAHIFTKRIVASGVDELVLPSDTQNIKNYYISGQFMSGGINSSFNTTKQIVLDNTGVYFDGVKAYSVSVLSDLNKVVFTSVATNQSITSEETYFGYEVETSLPCCSGRANGNMAVDVVAGVTKSGGGVVPPIVNPPVVIPPVVVDEPVVAPAAPKDALTMIGEFVVNNFVIVIGAAIVVLLGVFLVSRKRR